MNAYVRGATIPERTDSAMHMVWKHAQPPIATHFQLARRQRSLPQLHSAGRQAQCSVGVLVLSVAWPRQQRRLVQRARNILNAC
jgi:hypothetical protein